MRFSVDGVPAPQGSKSVSRSGHLYEANPRSREWRRLMVDTIRAEHDGLPVDEPVNVVLDFRMPRPKKPRFATPAVKPDLDKLTRNVLDALTDAGVLRDDSRVIEIRASKRYSDIPGVTIMVYTEKQDN